MNPSSYVLRIKTAAGAKGRSFRGVVLALAAGLTEGSKVESPVRPTLLMLACSPGESKPMLQNLREGRSADLFGWRQGGMDFELKGSTFAFDTQNAGPSVVISAWVPELFDYQPGVADADEVRFAVMPAFCDVQGMIAGMQVEVQDALTHLGKVFRPSELEQFRIGPGLVGEAAVFAWYLNQRCEPPRFPELAFSAQLFVAAQLASPALLLPAMPMDPTKSTRTDAAAKNIGFRSYVAPGVQMRRGFGFRASHDVVGTFMAEQVRIFDEVRRGLPSRRIATVSPGRAAIAALGGRADLRGAL